MDLQLGARLQAQVTSRFASCLTEQATRVYWIAVLFGAGNKVPPNRLCINYSKGICQRSPSVSLVQNTLRKTGLQSEQSNMHTLRRPLRWPSAEGPELAKGLRNHPCCVGCCWVFVCAAWSDGRPLPLAMPGTHDRSVTNMMQKRWSRFNRCTRSDP